MFAFFIFRYTVSQFHSVPEDCTKKFKWAKLWLMVPTIIRKYWCTHPNSIWAKAWGRTFLEVGGKILINVLKDKIHSYLFVCYISVSHVQQPETWSQKYDKTVRGSQKKPRALSHSKCLPINSYHQYLHPTLTQSRRQGICQIISKYILFNIYICNVLFYKFL